MKKKGKALSIVSIILCVISIAVMFAGVFYFLSVKTNYDEYREHYSFCYDKWVYADSMRSGYEPGSYWHSKYEEDAEGWMESWSFYLGKMHDIEETTVAIVLSGAVLLVISIILRIIAAVKKRKANKQLATQSQAAYGYVPVQGAPGQYQPVVMAPQVAPNGYVVNPAAPQTVPNGYVAVAPQTVPNGYVVVAPQPAPNGFVPPVAPAAPVTPPPVAPNVTRPVAPPPVKSEGVVQLGFVPVAQPEVAAPVEAPVADANETVTVEE